MQREVSERKCIEKDVRKRIWVPQEIKLDCNPKVQDKVTIYYVSLKNNLNPKSL